MENLSNKIVWNAKFVFVSFSKNFRKYLLEREIWGTNYLKLFKIYLNTIFFIFIYFSKNFREYIRMENQGNNNENIEKKCLENMRNNFKCVFRAYSLIIKRITRSAIIVEINTKDVKLVKTNISSLRSKRHLQSISLFT